MTTERFPVVKISDSLDGHTKQTGSMATFVRFAGCNLQLLLLRYGLRLPDVLASEGVSDDYLLLHITAYP
jgi:Organic radical activating enzymes